MLEQKEKKLKKYLEENTENLSKDEIKKIKEDIQLAKIEKIVTIRNNYH